jgi:hypothetical protein
VKAISEKSERRNENNGAGISGMAKTMAQQHQRVKRRAYGAAQWRIIMAALAWQKRRGIKAKISIKAWRR